MNKEFDEALKCLENLADYYDMNYFGDDERYQTIKQALINKSKTEQVLGIILELLDKCCKIYLIDGKTYYQIQIKVMHGDYTFGMSITKEEYYLLKEVL
jgi:hypothetical protein